MPNPSTTLINPAMHSKARLILERPGTTERLTAPAPPLFADRSLPQALIVEAAHFPPQCGPTRIFAFSLAQCSVAVDELADDGEARQNRGQFGFVGRGFSWPERPD